MRWGAPKGNFALVISATDGVTFDHNSIINSGPSVALLYLDGLPHTNFVVSNNIGPYNRWGVFSSFGDGKAALDAYAPGHVFVRNVIFGPNKDPLPPDNFLVASHDGVALASATGADGPVASMGPTVSDAYRNAGTDGKDIGVDFAALAAAIGSAGTV